MSGERYVCVRTHHFRQFRSSDSYPGVCTVCRTCALSLRFYWLIVIPSAHFYISRLFFPGIPTPPARNAPEEPVSQPFGCVFKDYVASCRLALFRRPGFMIQFTGYLLKALFRVRLINQGLTGSIDVFGK